MFSIRGSTSPAHPYAQEAVAGEDASEDTAARERIHRARPFFCDGEPLTIEHQSHFLSPIEPQNRHVHVIENEVVGDAVRAKEPIHQMKGDDGSELPQRAYDPFESRSRKAV